MKCIAAIAVDLDRSPLGTRSRLGDALGGKPVLRHTVERVLRLRRCDAVHVLSPAGQADAARRLLDGLDVRYETHDGAPSPCAVLVRAGRMWGLDGWRGGIGGLCAFDEDMNVAHLAALTQRVSAEAVVSVPAAAAVIDPQLIDAMIQHYERHAREIGLTIVQAPPGLGAVVVGRNPLENLAPSGQPLGVLLTYQPDRPAPDLTGKEMCHRPSAGVIEARGRLLCDTARSFARVEDLLAAGGETWDAARIAEWMSSRESTRVDAVPEEIEIELTTEDPLPDSLLRPRGAAVGRRGPMNLQTVRLVAESLGDTDDVRIVLGGFGDPCLHPAFAEVCRILRDSSAASIAVRTTAARISPAAEAALFETPVDVIEVTLDATTPQTYRRVHGVDCFEAVAARLEDWASRRAAERRVLPLLVPSFVKAAETLAEMEAFVDAWQRRLGTAAVTGYSHYAGQRASRAVTSTAPPRRGPCRRTFGRTLILADGRMTTCDQDFAGKQAVGRIDEAPLGELWHSERLGALRAGRTDTAPLCAACDEWHRP